MLSKIKSALGLGEEAPSVKDWVAPSDVFLVSYPKSGNTWMRFLFANLLKRDAAEEITFHNVHDYCPEVESQEALIRSMAPPRFLKSHQRFNDGFSKTIYIVRDGRDTYVSYYHYLLKKLPEGTTFAEFLKGKHFQFGRWSEHVRSWQRGRGADAARFMMVRYEDLLADAGRELARCAQFAGLAAPADRIAAAAEACSFERMRETEERHGRRNAADGAERFMRKGRAGDWREMFGPEETALFRASEDAALLAELGYRPL